MHKQIGIVIFSIIVLFYLLHLPITILIGCFAEYIFYKSKLRYILIKLIKKIWIEFTCAFFYVYFRNTMRIIVNKNVLESKRNIFISNHITLYDWIFLFRIFYHYNRFDCLIVALKADIRKIPIFGRGVELFEYIFLKREINVDKTTIEKNTAKIKSKERFFLLIFPEGTVFCKNTQNLCREFLVEKSIDFNPQTVLFPKNRGFLMFKEGLKDNLDGIINTTIFYSPNKSFIHDELKFSNIFFRFENPFHFYFLIDYMPITMETEKSNFLKNIWQQKNDLIFEYLHSNLEFLDFISKKVCLDEYLVEEISFKCKYTIYIYILIISAILLFIYKIFC